MKTPLLLFTLFCCLSLQLLAQQNPLVGTWQVVSIKGTDSDGTKITADGTQFKETKIITPTHYMLFTEQKQGDSLVFDKALAGNVRLEGNRYIEEPIFFSDQAHSKGKTNFTYRLQGDRFIQSGTFTTPDGKTGKIDELVFRKVEGKGFPTNPAIGSWNQLSSAGVNADGTKWSHTNATHTRFMIINPTHWMLIRHKDGQFESALGGTYKMEGNKFMPTVEMSSYPQGERKLDITLKVEGNKLHWHGILTDAEGKHTWQDVFEKVGHNATPSKTSSAK